MKGSSIMQTVSAILEEHPWPALSLVALTALTVRVLALISFQNSLYVDYLVYDEQVYHQWALKLASGTFGDVVVYDFAPFPAYVMAAIYKLLSPEPIYVRLFNVVLGTVSCVIMFLAGRRLGGFYVGLASGLIAAFYEPFIFFSVVLHKTALSVFLFSLFFYLCLVMVDRLSEPGRGFHPGTAATAFAAGIIMALLINVRSNAIVVFPVALACLGWICWRGNTVLRVWALCLCSVMIGFALAAAPFVVRDYHLTGNLALTPAGGFNLYIAHNPDNPLPYYRPVRFSTPVMTEQAIGFVIEASRREGRRLTIHEASSYWTREVLRYTWEEPGDFARRTALKTLAAFNRFESADNHHLGFLRDHISFLKWPFLSVALLLPLGMAGLVVTGFTSRKRTLAVLICLAYCATMIIFFTNVRIRLPMMVVLIPFAVMGLNRLFQALKERSFKSAGIYAAIATCFFTIAFVPVAGDKDFTGHLNTHALMLASKGRAEEALTFWRHSASMNQPYSAYADLSLALNLAVSGDIAQSLAHVERVSDASLAAAWKYEVLGDLMLQTGRVEEAIEAYKKSIDINSGQRRVRIKLLRVYLSHDRVLADREYAAFEYISSFYGTMQ